MDTKDIADLLVAAIGKVEFYWNFYTVTVLALIGWLASNDTTLTLTLKLLITVGYAVFVLMNIIGIQGSYLFAEAFHCLQRTCLVTTIGAVVASGRHE